MSVAGLSHSRLRGASRTAAFHLFAALAGVVLLITATLVLLAKQKASP